MRTAVMSAAAASASLALASPAVAAVTLEGDDRATAMFSATNVSPGAQLTRCIVISHSTDDRSVPVVRMFGESRGRLADHLSLVVDVGTGGEFDDCTGFSGSQVFSGTLAAFTRRHRDFGSGIGGAASASRGSRTWRLSLRLGDDPAAQGASVEAGFAWEAQTDDVPAPVPPVASPAVPSTAPSPSGPPSPANPSNPPGAPAPPGPPPAPTEQPLPPAPDDATIPSVTAPSEPTSTATGPPAQPSGPGPTGSATPTGAAQVPSGTRPTRLSAPPFPSEQALAPASPRAAVPRPEREDEQGLSLSPPVEPGGGGRPGASWPRALQEVLEPVGQVALVVAETTSFPVLLAGLVLLFLGLQDRLDRNDPKLAHSPVHADPHVRFRSPSDLAPGAGS